MGISFKRALLAGATMGQSEVVRAAAKGLKGYLGGGLSEEKIKAARELKAETKRLGTRAATIDALLRDKLEGTRAQEQALKGELAMESQATQQLLAQQLQQELGGISAEAGEARAMVGEAGAESGLLRSTFTGERLEDVSLAEQREKGKARFRTAEAIEGVRETERAVLQDIKDRREAMDLEFKMMERQQIQALMQNLDEVTVRQEFAAASANLQMAAAQKQAFLGTIGDLAGAAGRILGGACWVARAVFGEGNPKWRLARYYVVHMSPHWFFKLYMIHGEAFAKRVEKSVALKVILRPVFEYMVFRASLRLTVIGREHA